MCVCVCVCVWGGGGGVICKVHGVGSVTIACFRPESQALTRSKPLREKGEK